MGWDDGFVAQSRMNVLQIDDANNEKMHYRVGMCFVAQSRMNVLQIDDAK